MEPLTIVFGVIAVLGVGATVWLLLDRSRVAGRVASADAQAARAEEAQAARDESIAELRQEIEALESARDASSARVLELSESLSALRERLASAEEMRRQIEADRAQLKESFKALASDALKSSSADFMQLARTAFEGAHKAGQMELDKRRESFESLVKPIGETLSKTDARLIALTQELGDTKAATARVGETTARLARALSKPGVRGRYGEMQLQRVAEIAGMRQYCDFDVQATVRDGDSSLRPDMVVRLPAGRVIVVDAKTNIDAYVDAIEADTPEAQEEALARFGGHVADQVKKLAGKAYQDQFKNAPDFVVMFVPGDQFVDAALARQPDLLEKAWGQNVILTSPSTLIGLLRAVHVGWREHTLAERAEELRVLGRELHERAGKVFDYVSQLGESIKRASVQYNKLAGSIDSRFVPTLKKFEESGARGSKEIAEIPEIDVEVKALERTQELFEEEG